MRHKHPISGLLALFLSLPLPSAMAQDQAWEQYSKAGLAARQQGDCIKAEQLLNAALVEAEKGGKPSAELVQSLNSLAVVLTEMGKPGSAEPFLRRVLSIQQGPLSADSLDIARTMSNLAECLRQQGKLVEAEKMSRQVLAIVEQKLGNDDLGASVVLNNLAMILLDRCCYEESEVLMKRSLVIRETKLGPEDRAVGTVLNNLAVLAYRQGKYSEAETLYQRAIALWEKVLGPNHPDYALSLSNLAAVYGDQGDIAKAETLYRKALTIQEQALGADSAAAANSMRNLAVILSRKGTMGNTEAESLYRRAIEIQQKVLGKDDAELAITFHNLAQLYGDQQKFAQAQSACRESLRISENAYGPGDPRVATELRALARFAAAQGNSAEKELYEKRAESIAARLPGALTTVAAPSINKGTSPALNPSRPIKDKWALVIGISNFKDPALNLKYAAKDAIDFRNYLVSDGNFKSDHVKMLTDKMATRESIVKALGEGWLTRVANRDDLVVVYVSSHGSSAKQAVAGVNMLVAYDTNIQNQLATGIPMEWLTQIIKDQVHCDRVVLILDVCHSGAAQTASKGLTRRFDFNPDQVGVGSGQLVLCSSQSDQVSWESANYPNSVFTRRLIEGLRRNGAKTKLSEAFDYMQEHVEEEVLRDRAVVQTPVLRKLWSGDDVILSAIPISPRAGLLEGAAKPIKPISQTPAKSTSQKRLPKGK
jgi:tetratricopeptide (TPR) repeat protein